MAAMISQDSRGTNIRFYTCICIDEDGHESCPVNFTNLDIARLSWIFTLPKSNKVTFKVEDFRLTRVYANEKYVGCIMEKEIYIHNQAEHL